MDSTECSESKSDLGLGIIDTVCLFCVAGSDWWRVGLRHEIDETCETERCTFGDDGALVSSIRVTPC